MVKDDTITFGQYTWRVLDVKENRVLLFIEDIIELHWYHQKFTNITWADCHLRHYLNNEFYDQFSREEKAKIIAVTNKNSDNPWFKTKRGSDTTDSLFLLSLEEVCQYLGDSSAKLRNKGSQRWLIDDENNGKRQARYGKDFHWWRLRSPGYYGRTAASVNSHGYVYVRGNGVYGRPRDGGGLRPALWLKTEE